ncbi:hypothetical protein CPB86DRAFT_75195 [Serendipita vermifera]|nr:hypothetical protein CPB86DRAFT_75195 [Serendipita vermifera]
MSRRWSCSSNFNTTCPFKLVSIRGDNYLLRLNSPRVKSEPLIGEMLPLILSISHKYCMESLTNDILEELKDTSGYGGFVDIVIASQIIGSEQLYQEGIQRLVSSGRIPTKEQAKRMGAEATHAVMAVVINTLKETNAVEVEAVRSEMHRKVTTVRVEMAKAVVSVREEMLTSVDNTRCRFCPRSTRWTCAYCYQPQNIPNN